MFAISFGSLVTCFLSIIILTLYMHFILSRSRGIFRYHLKIIFIFSAIIMIRMLIPINFPFTHSIYGTKIMNAIGNILYFDLTEKLTVFDTFLIIWIFGAFIAIIHYIINRKKVLAFLKAHILSIEEVRLSSLNILSNILEQQKIQVACISEDVIPSIFGIIHPIIILPKDSFSSKDLQFILQHEIQHYRYYDLHLKIILDLLVAIHWWNPCVYRLRRYFNAAIEFSNDYMVTKLLNKTEKLQYAESLLNVAKKRVVNKQYDLSLVEPTYLKDRIYMLVNDDLITKRRKRISIILNVMFITILMTISLIFVPEANYNEYAQEVYEEENAFSITADNAYFIKSSDGYKLYMDGEYIITIKNIPEDLREVPIYEE